MLDSIKSINIVSAYSAKDFKTDRDLSEVRDLFKSEFEKKDVKKHEIKNEKKNDVVEISQEALNLLENYKFPQ
jgi:hypothetical protein